MCGTDVFSSYPTESSCQIPVPLLANCGIIHRQALEQPLDLIDLWLLYEADALRVRNRLEASSGFNSEEIAKLFGNHDLVFRGNGDSGHAGKSKAIFIDIKPLYFFHGGLLRFLSRTRTHIRAAFCIVAVHAALGGDGDHTAADLNCAGLAADRDGALEGAVLRVVTLDGAVADEHGNRLAVAPDIEGVVDGDRAFVGAIRGVAAFDGGGVFEDGDDAVGVEWHGG